MAAEYPQSLKKFTILYWIKVKKNTTNVYQLQRNLPPKPCTIWQHLLHTPKQHAEESLLNVLMPMDTGSKGLREQLKHIKSLEKMKYSWVDGVMVLFKKDLINILWNMKVFHIKL